MDCRLLTITEDYIGVPSPEGALIPEFKRIIDRDDSENKQQASRELAFIYYMIDWESPYAKYSRDRRFELIKDDLFDEDWEPDEAVKDGLDKYEEMYANDYTKMLGSAREGARKLRKYFEDVDLNETDHNGKLKYKATDLTRNLKDVGSIIEGLQELEELVKKNQTTSNKNRGDVEVNEFSKGSND